MKIGFVGYSRNCFNQKDALKIIYKIFYDLIKQYGTKDVSIVSGATEYGVIKLVYQVAVQMGYRTVGVMCKEGYDCKVFPVDELIVEGENWGDESEVFIDAIDVLYRIGGGKQSLKECEMARNKGIPVIEFELEELIDNRLH